MGYEDNKVTPSAAGENGASDKPLLSIVVPLFNEQEVFSALQTRLLELQSQIGTEYRIQIVLVDDGSADHTWPLVKAFADQHSFVKGVSLSRNFGHQRALFCGYTFCGRRHRGIDGRRPAGSARSNSGHAIRMEERSRYRVRRSTRIGSVKPFLSA